MGTAGSPKNMKLGIELEAKGSQRIYIIKINEPRTILDIAASIEGNFIFF